MSVRYPSAGSPKAADEALRWKSPPHMGPGKLKKIKSSGHVQEDYDAMRPSTVPGIDDMRPRSVSGQREEDLFSRHFPMAGSNPYDADPSSPQGIPPRRAFSAGYADRMWEGGDTPGTLPRRPESALDELHRKSPYNRELCKDPRRKARRKFLQLHKSVSEPYLHAGGRSPKRAQSATMRSESQMRPPHHLPALNRPHSVSGSFPRPTSPGSPKKGPFSPQMAAQRTRPLTAPPIHPSKETLDPRDNTMAQTMFPPGQRRKKPAQALKTIFSAAQSITKDLDRAMRKLQGFEEDAWASSTLGNVEEGEEGEEMYDLHTGTRLTVSPTDTAGLINALGRPSELERKSSKDIRKSVIGVVPIEEMEEPQGLNEERLKQAFLHFVEPGTFDLSIQNLLDLLRYVGHPVVYTTGAAVQELVKEVTNYEYLDYDEFISFMERYVEYEREHFREVFKTYDEDGSGELDLAELRLLIKEVGIMGLSGMMGEAIRAVDVDNSGQLDFEEFLKFLRIYQRHEGFTSEEVEEISDSMEQIRAGEGIDESEAGNVIPVELLSDVLVRFFGTHTAPDAKNLQQKLIDRHILHNPHAGPSFMMSLRDVLLNGRQIREKYYGDLKNPSNASPAPDKDGKTGKRVSLQVLDRASMEEIEKFDDDGDQKISEPELKRALKKMGYEPLTVIIHEILDEVLPEPFQEGMELEFDEFFDFLLVYRQRESFSKSEVKAFKGIFHTFDEDGSGDVSTLELGDVFRYMGYSLTVDELKRYVLLVDEDRTNELNFREFLRLMHLHRNSVLRQMRDAFTMKMDLKTEKLPRSGVLLALNKLGLKEIPPEISKDMSSESLDFEEFVKLADDVKAITVSLQRKRAGFTDTELDNILELFRRFDKDGSGDIDCQELQQVFTAFGWSPNSAEEQQEIFGRLDRARALAREAGVEDTTEDGSAEIRQWEFVQLARMIRRQQETAEERAMAKLAHDLRFSMPEVNEFHEVYRYWLKQENESDDESEDGGEQKEGSLSRETVRRIVRTMGVRFSNESKELLDKQMELLGKGEITIDFQAFLHLMRWILDTDFGGLCTAQSEAKTDKKDKKTDNKRGSVK